MTSSPPSRARAAACEPGRIPTIHDVARAASVATSTVSRALRGEPRVSASTRDRIRGIADDLGYRPSRSALSLRSLNTRTLGLLVPNLDNPIAVDHLKATVRAAFAAGYTVFVADGQDSPQIQDAELQRMIDYRVDGLILGRGSFRVTPGLVRLAASGIRIEPEIIAANLEQDLGRTITAYRERTELDATAAIIAYRRLAELGHRRFAIFVRASGAFAEARRAALEATLLRAGLDSPRIITVTIAHPDECLGEVQALAASQQPPTAIISAGGILTPHILQALQLAGLRVPADVSVLAFGDSEWHRAYCPPISVIRHDYVASARRSLERLVARIEGQPAPVVPRRPSEFVLRESFGPAASDRNSA